MNPEQLEREWQAAKARAPIDTVMRFGAGGLVLGLGAVLSPAGRSARDVSMDVSDTRLLTLLAAAHLRPATPGGLAHLRKAAQRWRENQDGLASMHLALSGLDRLRREAAPGV